MRHIEKLSLARTGLLRVYRIFNIINAYSRIPRHYQDTFRLIQAYSAPCVTFAHSEPCHILSPAIFRTGVIIKTLWNFEKAYSALYHRTVYSAFFRYTETYLESDVTLAYAETWHIWNPGIFRILQ